MRPDRRACHVAAQESATVVAVPAPSRVLRTAPDVSLAADEEEAFFASLHQSNGTTRMTRSGRLDDVNVAIAGYLPAASRLETLDVGISSGISTLEWLLDLERIGRECAMTAFDRVLYARLYCAGPLQMLAERSGYVLLIHNGHRAYTRPVRRIASWRNRFVRGVFRLGDSAARLAEVVGAGVQVPLISSRLRLRPDVQLVEHDLFSPAPQWIGRFHAVRVANLLNRSYFPDSMLRAGLRNAASWVRRGGLLAVVRTETDGRNHATLFRREAAGLTVIHRLGSGSEVEALITAFPP